jgi:hypothetical protein
MAPEKNNSELIGSSPLVHARVAGLAGLAVLVSGSFTGFVGSKLVLRGDPVATSSNIVASELLFRLGLISSLIMMICWLFYALLLFRLLKPINKGHATIMVGLVLASVPLFMLNQVHLFAALLSASDRLYQQVNLFLEVHRFGNLIAGIFFGLWLFPFGLLVFKSGYFPRLLGISLMIGTLGYLILFVQGFLFAPSEGTLWTNPFLVVTHLAELTMMLWLLIRGLNVDQWERRVLTPQDST